MKKRLVKKIAMLMVIVLVLSSCVVQAFAVEYEGAGDLIKNHTFDNGVSLPWRVVETYPATADSEITADGKCKITLSKIGYDSTGERWDVQFLQRGLTLLQGHTYTVKFTVTADRDCLIYPKIGDQGDPYEEYWNMNQQWQFLELKANMPKTVNATFTQTRGDKSNVEFAFQLAPDRYNAPSEYTGTFQPITFTFDDIYLKDPQYIGEPRGATEPTNVVRLNQEGFYPDFAKIATVLTSSTTPINWQLVNSAGTVVLAGKSTVKGADHASGDNVHIIDFSNYRTAGTGYKIVTDVPVVKTADHPADNESMPFNIGNDIYSKMKYDSVKYFYHHRSGIPITMPYADGEQWTRPTGHYPDILAPDPTKDYIANYTLDVTGGWYDSGDFGKYVINGGISTWTLMNSYERALYYGDTSVAPYKDGSLNIPESGNGFPDILDEARYNLNALLNMQVPAGNTLAGMVHRKAGDVRWLELAIRPDQDKMERYLQPPTTAATLNLAAIAAQGSRLWRQYDAAFAQKCLTAAETAWDAAVAHPAIYPPPSGLGGPTSENYLKDDFYWAACELYVTTGSQKYLDYIKNSPHYLHEPIELTGEEDTGLIGPTGCFDLDNTAGMGTITLALVPNGLPVDDVAKAKTNIMAAADKFLSIEQAQGYGVPIEEKLIPSPFDQPAVSGFPLGSNSFVVNNAIVMSYAYLFSQYNSIGYNKYLNGALTAMDYILGRNPNVQSYVTGYGDNPLENPNHCFWAYQADNSFPHPPAGCMSGGPNSNLQDPWVKGLGWQPGNIPSEKCFVDNIESWSTNEISTNWNAPLAWMSAFLDEQGQVICGGTPGDINSDGQKDAIDYALIKKALLNGDTSIQNADLNNDGYVDAVDLALYKSYLLGKANF